MAEHEHQHEHQHVDVHGYVDEDVDVDVHGYVDVHAHEHVDAYVNAEAQGDGRPRPRRRGNNTVDTPSSLCIIRCHRTAHKLRDFSSFRAARSATGIAESSDVNAHVRSFLADALRRT